MNDPICNAQPFEGIEVSFRPSYPIDTPDSQVQPFHPGTVILEAGHVHEPGRMPLPCEICWERDVAVLLGDGVTIYVDVYRPVEATGVPAILVWTPYGKEGGWWKGHVPLEHVGVPRDAVSGLQSFESPDPA